MEGFLKFRQKHLLTGASRTRGALAIGAPPVTMFTTGPASTIPLSFNDARFASNTAGSTANVSGNTTYANKTWDDSPLFNTPPNWDSEAPFDWVASGTTFNISKSRWKWREGFRAGCDNNAILNMSECYIECVGRDMTAFGATRPDHSDCFQAYSPGGSGVFNISKTCFRAYTDEEAFALYGGNFIGSAALMYADDFQGELNLTDVLFWGGQKGIEFYADVGTSTVRFNNVYFVPSSNPWPGNKIIMGVPGATAQLIIAEWNNVREATIVNGAIVPGALIPEPTGTRIINTGGGSSVDPGLFNAQTGTFTIEWDAVPSGAGIDVVTGVSNGAPTAFSSIACSIIFATDGTIKSRNGGAPAASNVRTYTAGVSYHCKMVINVVAKTYSSYVTPAGGVQVQIATNYAFRTEQNTVTSLNYLGKWIGTGDVVMTNMVGPPVEALPPVVTNATFSLVTSGTGWSAGKVVGTVTATRSPTSWSIVNDTPDYFDISSAGVITVTSAGVTALTSSTGTTTLTVQANNANGNGQGTVTIKCVPVVVVGSIPLAMNDPRFASNTAGPSGPFATGSQINKDWINSPSYNSGDQPWEWTGNGNQTFTLSKCRVDWREGPRISSGSTPTPTLRIDECFFHSVGRDVNPGTGTEDHADCLQAFSRGGRGLLWVTNSCFRSYSDPEASAVYGNSYIGSAGIFWADDFQGEVRLDNVVIMGGGRGIAIYADVGTTRINFNNVYFIEKLPGGWGSPGFEYDIRATGGSLVVDNWTNVRRATIDGAGNIVPGVLLPSP